MINFDRKKQYGYDDLCRIVAILRHDGGCPWDMEQTHQSIRRNFLEETYEACEAIDTGDMTLLQEELGDVLLQVVFHADIERDAGGFTMDSVCDGICKKLIRRHPHVFGSVSVTGTEDILNNWDEIKKQEHHHTSNADVLDSVARSLPALWRAEKLQKKAAKFGQGTVDPAEARQRLRDLAAMDQPDLGDLLFAAVDLCRLTGQDPEEVLHRSCEDYITQFRQRENP